MPDPARELQSLPRVDYADAFRVALPEADAREAENWARAALEGSWASTASRARLRIRLWWAVVAWNLHPALSPDRVAGWRVVSRSRTSICIEAAARWGRAQIVFLVVPSDDGKQLVMTTFAMFGGWPGRAYFTLLIGPAHRRVAPQLVARAATNPRPG